MPSPKMLRLIVMPSYRGKDYTVSMKLFNEKSFHLDYTQKITSKLLLGCIII